MIPNSKNHFALSQKSHIVRKDFGFKSKSFLDFKKLDGGVFCGCFM